MLILGILAAVFVISLVIYILSEFSVGAPIVCLLSGVLLFVGLLLLPLEHLAVKAGISQFIATQQTVTTARGRGESTENAAMVLSIAEANRWLASIKVWNHSFLGLWVPDEVDALQPIE